MPPTVSVIIPIYNLEKYLPDCLNSILRQSYRDLEIICVDDGSTDSSSAIIEEFKKQDPRIIAFHQENQGQSAARNIGIDYAKGKYLCFVDGDDMLVENALEMAFDTAERDNCEIVTYETELMLEEATKHLRKERENYYYMKESYTGLSSGREKFCERMENREYIDSASLLFIKREWLSSKGIRFLKGVLYEDSIFALECFFECARMRHIHARLYVYRIRENSTMTKKCETSNLYFRLWQVIECFHIFFSKADNEREKRCLIHFAQRCLNSGKTVYYGLSREDQENLFSFSPDHRFIYQLIGFDLQREFNGRQLEVKGLLSDISQLSGVILYGAGVVGHKMMRLLEKYGLGKKIVGFAVTEGDEHLDNNYTVKPISCYSTYKDSLVIITTAEWHHGDIIRQLKAAGFTNYYAIGYPLERDIDKLLMCE